MKKNVFNIFFFLGMAQIVFSQSTLDSFRLILPIGHGSKINDIVYTDDNKYIITCSDDNTCKIWEFSTGKLIRSLNNHNKRINGIDYNPLDKLILTYSEDASICIWNLNQSSPLFKLDGHLENINKALFNPKRREVISVSDDDMLIVWDLNSGKIKKKIKAHRDDIIDLVINDIEDWAVTFSKDGIFKIWQSNTWDSNYTGSHGNNLSKLVKQNSKKDNIYFIKKDSCLVTFNVNKRSIVSEVCNRNSLGILNFSISKSEQYIIASDINKKINLFDVKNKNKQTEIDTKDYALDISINNYETRCAFSLFNGSLIEYDLIGNKLIYENEISEWCLEKITYLGEKNYFCVGDMRGKCWIIESGSGRILHDLYNKTNAIKSINSYKKDSELVICIANENPRIFDYNKLNYNLLVKDCDFLMDSDLKINENKFILYNYYMLASYDKKNKTKQFEINPYKNNIVIASYTPNGNLIYITTNDPEKIDIYESNNGLLYDSIIILDNYYNNISNLTFSKNDSTVYLGSLEGIVYGFNTRNKKELFRRKITNEVIKDIYLDSDYKNIIIVSRQEVFFGNINSLKFKPIFKTDYIITDSYFMKDKIYLSFLSGEIIELNLNTKKLKSKIKVGYPITAISQILKNNIIGIGCINGSIEFWDLNEEKLKFSLINLEESNYIIKLQNAPYYMGSKDASKMLHYVTPNLKVIGFDQLDPAYNRPDIVLDSIGKYFGGTDIDFVTNYRKLWEKHIDRLGLNKEMLNTGEISVPDAVIIGADDIEYENKNGELNLKISANDTKYLLKRFNVLVNEVPVYGSTGINIADLKKYAWDTTVNISLSAGVNKIQVSIMNELGLENFKYSKYVNFTPPIGHKSKIYFIGIGVNEFKESSKNLKYCVKDVIDLGNFLSGPNTEVKLFINDQVTKENILALKEYLSKTSVNDKVIISCSSHGLLDENLDFYLAMHDLDFNKPEVRGLKYEELEKLLDSIPARQKLLLLDACYSGENDKKEVLKKHSPRAEKQKEAAILEEYNDNSKNFIKQIEEFNKNNFVKMSDLFINFRNNTGSIIISAAGGQESALEAILVDGKIIENGAFTYSILECLRQNRDNKLTVNALKKFTEKLVEKITNGEQKPTSRQEMLEINWEIND